MPGTNAIKIYLPDTYYHLYNRGVDKQQIFFYDADYTLFESLLERYLSEKPHRDYHGRLYPSYHGQIRLFYYCLMPNHFHLLIKTNENPRLLATFMSSHQTAFTKLINHKYQRKGHLFQERYKAVVIQNQDHLERIRDYIHENPKTIMDPRRYPYSSIKYVNARCVPSWISAKTVFG